MNPFRLFSLSVENDKIQTDEITLVDRPEKFSSENYFSLIIGNNGTGKSRLLSHIAKYFKGGNRKSLSGGHMNYNSLPDKVIAITNSISDKFPIDESYKFRNDNSLKKSHKDLYYNYFGNRNRFNGFSNKSLMNKALEIVIENFSALTTSRNYRHIFKYLEYEPIIKINCRLKNRYGLNGLNRSRFNEFIQSLNSNTFEEYDVFYKFSEDYKNFLRNRAPEIIAFLNNNFEESGNYNFTINFSEKNILRISNNHSIYEDNVNAFEIINILRKLEFIETFEIQLYKIDGMPFSFSDASSGEAGILSTLLALIPIVSNNSLILIDEPEISLHPLWQSRYIDLLNKILDNVNGCHIIIASHSPFLATDLNPNNSAVIALQNKRGLINSNLLKTSTFGWSTDDILLNVFELETTRNYKLYSNITKALYLLANEDFKPESLIRIKENLLEFYPLLLDNDPAKAIIKGIIDVK